MSDDRIFLFGPCCLIVGRRELLIEDRPVPLGNRAFDLLMALIEQPGQVVSKDELMAAVWPGVFVEENNLTTQISTLRRVLNDGTGGRRYIVTAPARGYCFVAPLEIRQKRIEAAEPSAAAAEHTTFTFLAAEIDDALGQWQSHPAEMQIALPRFEALFRAEISACRGDPYRASGDALRAAFATVEDAAAAAVAIEGALGQAEWAAIDGFAVAISIHVGSAVRRQGDYHGLAATSAAELASIAHGGQILLSAAAAGLMRAHLEHGLALIDLGECRAYASTSAEHVYQLSVPGQRTSFPPLRWLTAIPHNLPQQPSPIIGRETELADLGDLVARHRIVSLCGMGGLGKTRLAIAFGHEMLAQFRDGVWFISLERLNAPELVPETIAGIFGLPTGRMPAEAVLGFLRQKDLLLIFDNAEHLMADVAGLVDEIAKRCPGARIAVTSREVLGVPGECIYRVPPLGGPDRTAGISAQRALRYGAIRLFAERATAALGNFTLGDDLAPIVAEICLKLDRNALAIELAAARLKLMPPRELLARLEDRFGILTGGSRVAQPRQQTLRAMIDWSYDLLPEEERILLNRLSVFGGSFTLDSVAPVAGGDPLGADLLTLAVNLVDKSLVAPEPNGGARLRLLELTRAYAAEKLGAAAAAGHRRLATHLVELLSRADGDYETLSTTSWRTRYGPEIDNLRAAIGWALGGEGDAALGAALAAYGGYLWTELSLIDERQRWLTLALERAPADLPPRIAARLHMWRVPRGTTGVGSKRAAAERGVELARAAGEPMLLARALTRTGTMYIGPDTLAEASALFREAIALVRGHGKTRLLAGALNGWAAAHAVAGDFASALPLYEECAATAEALGADAILISVLSNRAEIACSNGDLAMALALARRGLEAALSAGDRVRASVIYCNLSAYHLLGGEPEAAAHAAAEALGEAPALAEPFLAADAIQALALVSARLGDPARAARLLGFVESVYAADQKSREDTEAQIHRLLLAELDRALPDAECQALMAEGASWSEDEAAAVARTVIVAAGAKVQSLRRTRSVHL